MATQLQVIGTYVPLRLPQVIGRTSENIKVPWTCQGNVNGPSPSLVGVHTSFPGLSEGTAMTVSTAWGPKYGGLTTRCASNPWVSGYAEPQSSLQLQHLEALATGFVPLCCRLET